VLHTQSSGPTPNRTKPRTPYATHVKEIVTSIAPDDGHVSPKHVELKELK